jgi:hypothetical protein
MKYARLPSVPDLGKQIQQFLRDAVDMYSWSFSAATCPRKAARRSTSRRARARVLTVRGRLVCFVSPLRLAAFRARTLAIRDGAESVRGAAWFAQPGVRSVHGERPTPATITQDAQAASAAGITGTPTFVIGRVAGGFVVGNKLVGAQSTQAFQSAIESLLQRASPVNKVAGFRAPCGVRSAMERREDGTYESRAYRQSQSGALELIS